MKICWLSTGSKQVEEAEVEEALEEEREVRIMGSKISQDNRGTRGVTVERMLE